jgi:hypothetical protein
VAKKRTKPAPPPPGRWWTKHLWLAGAIAAFALAYAIKG